MRIIGLSKRSRRPTGCGKVGGDSLERWPTTFPQRAVCCKARVAAFRTYSLASVVAVFSAASASGPPIWPSASAALPRKSSSPLRSAAISAGTAASARMRPSSSADQSRTTGFACFRPAMSASTALSCASERTATWATGYTGLAGAPFCVRPSSSSALTSAGITAGSSNLASTMTAQTRVRGSSEPSKRMASGAARRSCKAASARIKSSLIRLMRSPDFSPVSSRASNGMMSIHCCHRFVVKFIAFTFFCSGPCRFHS